MRFIQDSAEAGAQKLGEELTTMLGEDKQVLWLLSGGSNIPLEVQALRQVPDELRPDLTIMPMDERYGPVGHADSNVRKLLDAGFQPGRARFIPTLQDAPLDQVVESYGQAFSEASAASDVIVAQMGMGADGHVAGILPQSPAAESQGLATGYKGPDFQRVTLTFPALKRIHTAYLFAYGEGKKPALEHLLHDNLPPALQPAQILKAIPKAYIYNDQIEEGGRG